MQYDLSLDRSSVVSSGYVYKSDTIQLLVDCE